MGIDKNLVPEEVLQKLIAKGMTEELLQKKLDEVIEQGKKLSPNNVDLYVKNRVRALFASFLNSTEKVYNGVIFGIDRPKDDNAKAREYSIKNEGQLRKSPDGKTSIKVQKGVWAWGNDIGKPIPEEPNWKCDVLVGLELDNTLVLKKLSFRLEDGKISNYPKLTIGNKITFKLDEKKLNNKTIGLQYDNITETGNLGFPEMKQLVDTYMKSYKITCKELIETKRTGYVVLDANIGEITTYGAGGMFTFADESLGFEDMQMMNGYLPKITFIQESVGLIYIGDVYSSPNNPMGFGMNTLGVLVPEVFKVPELTQEQLDTINQNYDESTKEALDDVKATDFDVDDLL